MTTAFAITDLHLLPALDPAGDPASKPDNSVARHLAAGQVHLWWGHLDLDPAQVEHLRDVLSPEEQAKAWRFRFERDRQQYIAARGTLRHILAGYTGMEPGRLAFEYSAYGKPSLAGQTEGQGIRFNLAHSDSRAIYGVAWGRELGVDLERVRPLDDYARIAGYFFSSREVAALSTIPPNRQLEAFFKCWSRKEAYIKARGAGLSLPLDQFDVTFDRDEPASLHSDFAPEETARWTLHDISSSPGYAGALVVEKRDRVGMAEQIPLLIGRINQEANAL